MVGNLYFSDIDNNRLHKLAPTGGITSFHAPSNRANGPRLDLDGGLLICEQEAQRLVKMDGNGNITVVADGYQGKPFNSPNNIWVHPNGSIYMTDPRYQHPLKKWDCYDSGEKKIQRIYQQAIGMHKDLNFGDYDAR